MNNALLTSRLSLFPAATNSARRPTTVLVVDDEEHNRTLLRDPLEASGYAVIEAINGRQALEILEHPELVDVILLDVMMPEIDGMEVCCRLKQNSQTAQIPVLMVTALTDRQERLLGIRSGANDFLSKPIDLQDVLLRVGNAAQFKRLYDQIAEQQQISDALLLNLLPQPIAARMKAGEITIADLHQDVSVMVADLVGFSRLAAHIEPSQLVNLLDEIFSSFDLAADALGLDKIKTVGDSYVVAAGLTKVSTNHPGLLASFGLQLQTILARLNTEYKLALQLRSGIATGPAVAGVIGRKRLAYDLWGATVDLAFDLKSAATAGSVLISEATFLRAQHQFSCRRNEQPVIIGARDLIAYELISRKSPVPQDSGGKPRTALEACPGVVEHAAVSAV